MKPDRVIGTDSDKARGVYDSMARSCVTASACSSWAVKEAEMTKYAANASAGDQDFLHERDFKPCDRMGVDVESVRQGIGSDSRIGYSFASIPAGFRRPRGRQQTLHGARGLMVQAMLLAAAEPPPPGILSLPTVGSIPPGKFVLLSTRYWDARRRDGPSLSACCGQRQNGRCDRKDSRPALHLRFRGLE